MLKRASDSLNMYAWLIPGADTRHVNATGSIDSPGSSSTVTILSYTVPEGMIFSLRGVAVVVNDPNADWVEGSSQLVFTLNVTAAGGTRPVEYFANLVNRYGSQVQPYPVLGRTDFEENNTLSWVCVSDGTVLGANLVAALVGFERPAVSCGGFEGTGGSPVR